MEALQRELSKDEDHFRLVWPSSKQIDDDESSDVECRGRRWPGSQQRARASREGADGRVQGRGSACSPWLWPSSSLPFVRPYVQAGKTRILLLNKRIRDSPCMNDMLSWA